MTTTRWSGDDPLHRFFIARRRTALLAVTVFYFLVAAAVTYPQVRLIARAIPNMVDGYFNIWRLAWVAHQLPRHPLDLFNANIFYPERNTLAFSDAILAPAFVTAPFFWLRINPVLIYNTLFLSAFALSGLTTFLLVDEIGGGTLGAIAAGAFFVAAPYRFDHWVHLEMQMTVFAPMALWALHRTARTLRWSWAATLGAAVALQTYSSIYYGIFLLPVLAVVAALLLLAAPRPPWRRLLPLLAGAGLVAAVCVLPYMRPYLAARRSVGDRPAQEVEYYSAVPQDYLSARPDSTLYGGHLIAANNEERHLFPGFLVLGCVVLALWPPVSQTVAVYLIAAALAFESSLGLNGFVFSWLRTWVLPFQGIRVPARFGIFVALLLAVLAGLGVNRLRKRIGFGAAAAIVAIAIAGSVIEARAPVAMVDVPSGPSVVDTWLRDQPSAAVVELPLPPREQPFQESEGQPLYHSIFHWQPILNGVSGFFPDSYLELLDRMRTLPDRASVDYLRQRHVRYIVMRRYMFANGAYEALRARIAATPGVALVGRFPERSGESVVFALDSPR